MNQTLGILNDIYNALNGNLEVFKELWNAKNDVKKMVFEHVDDSAFLSDNWEKLYSKIKYACAPFDRDNSTTKEYKKTIAELTSLIKKADENIEYYISMNELEKTWSDIVPEAAGNRDTLRLDKEYERFMGMIKKGDHFAFVRNGDDERSLIMGHEVHAQENWHAPNHVTALGEAIRSSISYKDDNYYYGVSCPCCDPKAFFWYWKNVGDEKKMTFANLWVNGNYQRFYRDFLGIKRDAVVIANYRAAGKPIASLNVLKYYSVSDDCISFWNNEADGMINHIIEDFGDCKDILFVVSAGPMAGPIIERLYKNNKNNCYIDFGSALDGFYREEVTRPYMIPDTIYAKKNCWMPDINQYKRPVITAVMTLYKRPENLRNQLEAIENQTLPPDEIILFQDHIDSDVYDIILKDQIKKRFSNVRICESNQGVWGRFLYAAEVAVGDYVCVFDDDTIPGNRWFENCYIHMFQKEAIYGTVGITMYDHTGYPFIGYGRTGWPTPLNRPIEVDFVGHSWFMPIKALKAISYESEAFQRDHKYVGEDAYLSYINRKLYDMPTVIPPHHKYMNDTWGSISREYGVEDFAVSMSEGSLMNMRQMIGELYGQGWEILENRSPNYINSMEKYYGPNKGI